MKLREDDLQPGEGVSMDHYESMTRGRLPFTKGKEIDSDKFRGGTIAVDHSSTKIWVEHQVSLRAGETLRSKHIIERDFYKHRYTVKRYHSDNGVFRSNEFQHDLKLHGQLIDFSGVGAHHQNGIAEKHIRDITESTRTRLLHAVHRWPPDIR